MLNGSVKKVVKSGREVRDIPPIDALLYLKNARSHYRTLTV